MSLGAPKNNAVVCVCFVRRILLYTCVKLDSFEHVQKKHRTHVMYLVAVHAIIIDNVVIIYIQVHLRPGKNVP